MGHVNIFKTKSKEELVKLYGEFLKVEETGFFDPDRFGWNQRNLQL